MSATDELRQLLDERGVKWWEGIGKKSTVFDGEHDVRYEVDGTLGLLFIRSVLHVTPEQAIAATLGNDGVERSNDGVDESDQLKGRLTAEQVRAAIFNGSGYASFDGVKYYADGIEMQAIADELNATRGRTTTRNTMRTVYGNPRPVCEVCGYGIGDKRWHYCPKCGARIKGAK